MSTLKEEEEESDQAIAGYLENGQVLLKSGEIAALEIISNPDREEKERSKMAEYASSLKSERKNNNPQKRRAAGTQGLKKTGGTLEFGDNHTNTSAMSTLKEDDEEADKAEAGYNGQSFLKSGEIAVLEIIGGGDREEQERLKMAEYAASAKADRTNTSPKMGAAGTKGMTAGLDCKAKTTNFDAGKEGNPKGMSTPEEAKKAGFYSATNSAADEGFCIMDIVEERASDAVTSIATENSLRHHHQSTTSERQNNSSVTSQVGAYAASPSLRTITKPVAACAAELGFSLRYDMGAGVSHDDPQLFDESRDAENESGLVVAQPVDEETATTSGRGPMMEAEEMDLSENRQRSQQNKKSLLLKLFTYGVAVIVFLVLLLVFLYPRVGDSKAKTNTETGAPTASPTVQVTLSPRDFVLSLLPEYTLVTLDKKQDDLPQSKALEWLLSDPNLANYTASRIIQRYALSTFFYSTGGYSWTNNTNWLSYEVHECQWHHQDVRMLFGLFGNLPEADLQFLRPLLLESPPCSPNEEYTHLWLFMNSLQGTIPPEMTLLTTLTSVGLLVNQLTGPAFPPDIAKLSLLELYATLFTSLSGTIPTEVGMLSNLNSLRLSKSQIGGTIPSELGLLSDNLKVLDLADNQLTGVVSPTVGFMKNLSVLSLHINQLSGPLPSELGILKEAELLELGVNRFDGLIPSELGMLQNVSELTLDTNDLSGTVPVELSNLVINGNLKTFYLNNNSLTGIIPPDLCMVETVSNYNSTLTGCNCTCPIVHYHLDPSPQLCSPLPGCT